MQQLGLSQLSKQSRAGQRSSKQSVRSKTQSGQKAAVVASSE